MTALGGLVMTAVCVIFPPLLHYHCFKESLGKGAIFLDFFIVIFCIVFMTISTIYSVKGLLSQSSVCQQTQPLRFEILYIAQFPLLTNPHRSYLGHVSCFTTNATAKRRQKMPTPTYAHPRNRFRPPSQFVVVTTSAFSMLLTKKSTVNALLIAHSPSR